jgi:hypothetical protein
MNTSSFDNAIKLPSDLERQQIFYWLKRVSSVTAWRRIFQYYQAWAIATDNSLREADAQGWGDETSLPQSEYVFILKSLAHCEEAVNRLGKGDKRVFKFDANGELTMARRALTHWSQMLDRIQMGENFIKENTPLWQEFCDALTSLAQAWGECAVQILEPRYLDEPGRTLYGTWLQAQLKTMPYPNVLPAVPNPVDTTLIYTDQRTPCSGIWEPIDTPKNSLISLIKRPMKQEASFKIVGAMNYLHGGSKAPRITVEIPGNSFPLDTMWRLLWRDDRYQDGTIPEEEAHYRFTTPTKPPQHRQAINATGQLFWDESGTKAQFGGKWLVESDLNASIDLQKGEILPLYQGRSVRWVLAEK